ncbi:SSS family solute:Na+ symporter/sodium/proline symporter [Polymorphobacter multimanifer]|uniref:Sodium/proline symporter n=1 Tax=Polymorphobacter multimanifer TaxID=1070431 RepID=A0A841LAL3_9SPHN|nr:sodium/proline symporter PutP [Polymorphobacter multimanifer]MBB6228691.1 SSS family solute:Na+ symporter/sodium/proline symporter [Polymorphobacter multimanifer]
MTVETAIALAGYLLLMLGIGVYAWRTSTSNVSEFMLGGRQLSPAVAALSAGASDMSGWLLLGVPGAVYLAGLDAAWIIVGLVIGAWANYRLVAPRLRVYTEQADDALTIPDFLEKRFEDRSRALRVVSALVIVVFFTLYTSAGMVAGGKLFEASFGYDYRLGLVITAGVVLAYTLFGGFLAVSLTDFVQGMIMFVALLAVPAMTVWVLGGWTPTSAAITAVQPEHFSWLSGATTLGIISSLAWGLGYFGQPHIIVRFMAVRSVKDMPTVRRIGMGWMILSVIGAVFIGLAGTGWISAQGRTLADPETIFIVLAQALFNPYLAGFLLAAILAAIMSTISSQLLVSSSSLTEDLYKTFLRPAASQSELVLVGRLATLAVAMVAGILALDRSSTILGLVGNAWAGFGAAFGPVVLLSLHWKGLTRSGALAGMVAGAATVLGWLYLPFTIQGQAPSAFLYEIVPGVIAGFAAAIIGSKVSAGVSPKVLAGFDRMERSLG